MESGFKITDHKGFHITFKNGITVSTQFGPGNYCENREMSYSKPKESMTLKSRNAEIAIFDSDGTWFTRFCPFIKNGDDDVDGWVTPEKLLDVLRWSEELHQDEIKTLKRAYKKIKED